MKTLNVLSVFLPVAILTIIGCGAPEAAQATLEQSVYAQIEGLGDAASSEEMLADAFVAGSAPDNRDDYAKRGYQIAGEAAVDGETATVPVKIFGGVSSSAESDRGGSSSSTQSETEQMWTLQRTGDEWKIKDAPLG